MTTDPDFQPSIPLPTDTIPLRERLVVGATKDLHGDVLWAFCQDGSVFWRSPLHNMGEWVESSPIPGTPRHYQKVGKAMEG